MEKTAELKRFGLELLKGVLIGVSACLALILVFAFVLKFADLSEGWIRAINQIIKVTGIALACVFSVRGEKGWLKGMAVGFLVVVVTYLLFGLISSSLEFGLMTLVEALFGIAVGLLCGIISVNLKK